MEVNQQFPEKIRRIVEETAASYRAEAELDYQKIILPTVNDRALSEIGVKSVKNLIGEEGISHMEKTTGGEDFAFFAAETPAVFAFVGARNKQKVDYFPHHHPKFNIDEDSLEIASGLYVQFALDFLAQGLKD
jgi:amidohydrolase